MATRIVPTLLSRVISDLAQQEIAKDQKPTQETARVQNTDENHCPICGEPFTHAVANGLAVKTCLQHSIVMPVRD